MDTAVLEARAMASRGCAPGFSACMEEAQAILRDAADGWAAGDPERPTTLETLVGVLQVFVRGGLLAFPEIPKRRRG
jgi:hypothetical protein